MKRKIVQIAVGESESDRCLLALDDLGGVWMNMREGWERLSDLPQDDDKK